MIIGLSIANFTILHVIITFIAIGTGFIVMFGMLGSHRRTGWTAIFLLTTLLTSVTGFMFPIHGFTPALGTGIVATIIVAIALLALYIKRLAGSWCWIYAATAVASLYLNVFVLIVQSFQKLPFLAWLAPTQTEPPFAIAQGVALVFFVVMGIVASIRFRPGLALSA